MGGGSAVRFSAAESGSTTARDSLASDRSPVVGPHQSVTVARARIEAPDVSALHKCERSRGWQRLGARPFSRQLGTLATALGIDKSLIV